MDETQELLQHKDSIKSIETDAYSAKSFRNNLPAQILSPKSSFVRPIKGDSLEGNLFISPDRAESFKNRSASASPESKWSCPIDFELWAKSIDHSTGESYDRQQRFLFYSERTGLKKASSFDSLKFEKDPSNLLPGTTFWLDINLPTPSEMALIGRIFGIHPLTIEDIQTSDTREKCEVFPNYYFVT